MTDSNSPIAVVALGGNAITLPGTEDTIANQFSNTRNSLQGIIDLARKGYGMVVTHGNGPQVGNALFRIELARGKAPILPLGVLVADTEGGMGYMIEQSLQNRLHEEGIDRQVVTLITQMVVEKNDPAFLEPSKFIGQFYTEEEANRFIRDRGWQMKRDGERGFRRVVASPMPIRAVAAETIRELVASGRIVIAGGGGGVPVCETSDGMLEGIDAVIDKDLCSAVLGNRLNAGVLAILTAVDKVSINYGTDQEKELGECSLAEIKRYLKQGHFPAGSMGPKIEAAIKFIEGGGRMVVITSFPNAGEAISGKAGTIIVPD